MVISVSIPSQIVSKSVGPKLLAPFLSGTIYIVADRRIYRTKACGSCHTLLLIKKNPCVSFDLFYKCYQFISWLLEIFVVLPLEKP